MHACGVLLDGSAHDEGAPGLRGEWIDFIGEFQKIVGLEIKFFDLPQVDNFRKSRIKVGVRSKQIRVAGEILRRQLVSEFDHHPAAMGLDDVLGSELKAMPARGWRGIRTRNPFVAEQS